MAERPAYRRGGRISLTLSPGASRALDDLLAHGLFGSNRAAVAQELIYRGLRSDEIRPFTWLSATSSKVPKPRKARRR